MKTSGIYKIINKVNGKYYVGSSQNIEHRWDQHLQMLRNNQHFNRKFQRAYNKYKEDAFKFQIVLECDKDRLLIEEQKFLNECFKNKKNNYMICFDATSPNRGRTFSISTRKKLSKATTGKRNPNYGNHKLAGKSHFNFDHTSYSFLNEITNETYYGTRWDFRKKFNLGDWTVRSMIRKGCKSKTGWKIIPTSFCYEI